MGFRLCFCGSSFSHDEQCLFPHGGRQRNVAELHAAHPPRDILLLQGGEYLFYLLRLLGGILLSRNARQSVQFLVVVILRLGIGLQQSFPLADQMLPATLSVLGGLGLLGSIRLGILSLSQFEKNENDYA